MLNSRKRIIVSMSLLAFIFLALVGISYAYYAADVVGNKGGTSLSLTSGNLTIEYTNGQSLVAGGSDGNTTDDLTYTKTFTVENTGTTTQYYGVNVGGVTVTDSASTQNTSYNANEEIKVQKLNNISESTEVVLTSSDLSFERPQDWTFVLKVGSTTIASGTFPTEDAALLASRRLLAGKKETLTLTVTYNYITEAEGGIDQSADMGKSLNFKVAVSQNIPFGEPNLAEDSLLYAMLGENAIMPKSVPGNSPSGIKYVEGEYGNYTEETEVYDTYKSYYWKYGTGYTYDSTTNTYSLTGTAVTSNVYSTDYSKLVNKYVISSSEYRNSKSTKADAEAISTTGLTEVYKIISATSTSFTYVPVVFDVWANSYYWVYGTGYVFNENNGTFSLTGVSACYYEDCYNEFEGKYIIDDYGYDWNYNESTGEISLDTTNLPILYYVEKAGPSTMEVKTKILDTQTVNESTFSSTEDNYGMSYYYRGNVTNNFVNYSGMCWRIVRIEGNGNIKLALADENHECNETGYSVNNTTSAFASSNLKTKYTTLKTFEGWDDYLGEPATGYTVDLEFGESLIPNLLNNWATNVSLDTSKLATTEWCNDTNSYLETTTNRLKNNPTLKCKSNYKNTLGILSADEVIFAGAKLQSSSDNQINHNYYLQTNAVDDSWTMSLASYEYYCDHHCVSPSFYSNLMYEYIIKSNGSVYYDNGSSGYGYPDNATSDELSFRPVISLRKDVTIVSGGTGTQTNPYVIAN